MKQTCEFCGESFMLEDCYDQSVFECQFCDKLNYTTIFALKIFMDACEENTLKGLKSLENIDSNDLFLLFSKDELIDYFNFALEYYDLIEDNVFDTLIASKEQYSRSQLLHIFLESLQI